MASRLHSFIRAPSTCHGHLQDQGLLRNAACVQQKSSPEWAAFYIRTINPESLLGLAPLIRLSNGCVSYTLHMDCRIRVQLTRTLDGPSLRRPNIASPLRAWLSDGVIALRTALDKQVVTVFIARH
jgi:hypothetical protein